MIAILVGESILKKPLILSYCCLQDLPTAGPKNQLSRPPRSIQGFVMICIEVLMPPSMDGMIDELICFCWKNKIRGRRTLYRILGRSRRIQGRTRHGIVLKLDPAEYIDAIILQDGFYEPEVLDAILKALREGDTFWDVGSNLGVQALTVKKEMPSIQVVSFEPNPLMYPLIMDAARANHLDLDVRHVALSDREGDADFFIHRGNSGVSSLRSDWSQAYVRQVRVHLDRGDRLVASNECASPHVIKMDVEGHEWEVCCGISGLLQGNVLRTIVFEDSEDSASPVKKLLMENGYALRQLKRGSHDPYNFVAEKIPA
jgi:FkbM family methyltransferase